MSNYLMLDVGQANELKLAFRRAGYTNDEIKKLCKGDILANVLGVLHGYAEIKATEHLINCNVNPFIPSGWEIEEHRKGGLLKWDPAKVQLYLSDSQREGKVIKGIRGWEFSRELMDKPVLNACVLDYLIMHQDLIPEKWKWDSKGRIRRIFFWGTIYRRSSGELFVRFLSWNCGRWDWGYYWLGDDWQGYNPAALLIS